jgi:oxygen-dependent protoporphyrinogen oxidase
MKMRPKLPEDTLVTLLRQCYFTPRCLPAIKCRPVHLHIRSLRTSTRQAQQHDTNSEPDGTKVRDSRSSSLEDGFILAQSSHSSPTAPKSTHPPDHAPPQKIAILGGGITGLASAYYLSKELPSASITLYEASDRMGGWLQSKHVNVGNGKVVFEQGPRTLRPRTPAGLVTLELVIILESTQS